jgi:hypothetical protein
MQMSFGRPEVNVMIAQSMVWLRKTRWVLLGAGILWCCAIAVGLWILWDYENRPGVAANPPAQWPSASHLEPARDRPTLVMLVHPHCSCSRASLSELAVLMAQARVRPKTYVLFMKPPAFAPDWEKTVLWHSATAIPQVTAVRDDNGFEASLFGAARG